MGKIIASAFRIDEDLWKRFSVKVIRTKGAGRHKSEVLCELIKRYLEDGL